MHANQNTEANKDGATSPLALASGQRFPTMRTLELSRDDGELLTDLLMLTDHWCAEELDEEIRKRFGMCSRAQELGARGKSLAQIREEWARSILANIRSQP